MKRVVLITGITSVLILGSTMFSACGNAENKPNELTEKTGEHAEHTHFQCPMKCENDKFYEEAGKCPVCEMDLKKME